MAMILFLIMFMTITAVSASDDNLTQGNSNSPLSSDYDDLKQENNHFELENEITNAKNGDIITINPGTYKVNDINITKNITLQGNGNPRDIIMDGEGKSRLFSITDSSTYVTFKNITFINGLTYDFGGGIYNDKGHVYVDNCIFINNTASNDKNGGAICTFGTEEVRGYSCITNSLFVNNHADHDGGAIATTYGTSYISNCVFINNSAHRDGGAVRLAVYSHGTVEDSIFMYNHADEWGGAYYSWSGSSDINRCIFMNNTAGTNGGGVMVSGNLNLQNSIIANNTGEKTGGSFYIKEPMYQAETHINVNNNLITDNNSPKGKEVFIYWIHPKNLYTDFNDNDWGDENPNDSKVNDPNNVTSRIKVKTTKKSNLMDELNFNLLNKYSDLIRDYFPEGYLENIETQHNNSKNRGDEQKRESSENTAISKEKTDLITTDSINSFNQTNAPVSEKTLNEHSSAAGEVLVNGTSSFGTNEKKAYELNETGSGVSKTASAEPPYLILAIVIALIALIIGYKIERKENK